MNNKASKRTLKKQSSEELQENGGDSSFKSETEELRGFTESEINTKHVLIFDSEEQIIEEAKHSMVTRSQNSTPQPKKTEETIEENGDSEQRKENGEQPKENGEQNKESGEQTKENGEHPRVNGVENKQEESAEECLEAKETVAPEMEPLILEPDEPEPELQFDENSDLESGKNSPIVSRCTTRRSQIRNVPTPKTPRLIAPEQKEIEVKEPEAEETLKSNKILNESTDSLESVNSEDVSTYVAVGSDATRINFVQEPNYDEEIESPFLKSLKERSYNRLATRRSLRSVSRDRTITKSDLNLPYPTRASVESISGIKRKKRGSTPDDAKRFKPEPTGLLSYITSPVFNMKNRLLQTSTPKLTSFRNKNSLRDANNVDKFNEDVSVKPAQEKKWCVIM